VTGAVLRATSESGDVVDDPSEDALLMMFQDLEACRACTSAPRGAGSNSEGSREPDRIRSGSRGRGQRLYAAPKMSWSRPPAFGQVSAP